MDIEGLEKLHELREKGVLSEEEFQRAKEKLLADERPATTFALGNIDTKDYSMLMHLSQLCCFILPILGWAVPLVMWVAKRDDPHIDQQGRVIFNWIISSFIYLVVCMVLMLVVIGFFLFAALAICSLIFIILGAINAKDGIVRNYPLSIRFFPVTETPRFTPAP